MCGINRSSLDNLFEILMSQNNDLHELDIARYLPVIGFVMEIIIEILGIFLVYFMTNALAPFVVGENYNNNFLYSILFLPIINSLKKFPEILKSVFVRIAVCDKYIVCKRGYFRKFIDKLYLKHIDNIELRSTLWGEWFNYGKLDLYSFGGKISLPFLKNPCLVYEILRKKIEREGKEEEKEQEKERREIREKDKIR